MWAWNVTYTGHIKTSGMDSPIDKKQKGMATWARKCADVRIARIKHETQVTIVTQVIKLRKT
jgi:hypothetical protein